MHFHILRAPYVDEVACLPQWRFYWSSAVPSEQCEFSWDAAQLQLNRSIFASTAAALLFSCDCAAVDRRAGGYLVGVCAVLVLGPVRGVGEGLVAALVLADVWLLAGV